MSTGIDSEETITPAYVAWVLQTDKYPRCFLKKTVYNSCRNFFAPADTNFETL